MHEHPDKNDLEILTGRRTFIAGALAGLAAPLLASSPAAAQPRGLYNVKGDDGRPVVNYRVPPELSAFDLPGVLWTGSKKADVILVEFFDYNCPYCYKADRELMAMVRRDRNLRLGLVNNSILSVGSYQAARVQQSVLRLYGPQKALAFHNRLYQRRGLKDGLVALSVAKAMKLDAKAIEKSGDSDTVGNVLLRQVKLASSLGFVATPSFVLNGVGMLGYPGRKSLGRMIGSVRRCDKLVCA